MSDTPKDRTEAAVEDLKKLVGVVQARIDAEHPPRPAADGDIEKPPVDPPKQEKPAGGWKADTTKPRPDLLPWDVMTQLPGITNKAELELMTDVPVRDLLAQELPILASWYHTAVHTIVF
jgi:hypothetical protein